MINDIPINRRGHLRHNQRKNSMHYKNGTEAKENDHVIVPGIWDGGQSKVVAGRIHSLNPGATSCNAMLTYPVVGGVMSVSVNVGDCLSASDMIAEFVADAFVDGVSKSST